MFLIVDVIIPAPSFTVNPTEVGHALPISDRKVIFRTSKALPGSAIYSESNFP